MKPRVFALLAIVVFALLPADGFGIPLCPLHLLTGLACPLCGITRSLSSLLQGEWSAAFAYHPLGLFVLVWLIMLVGLSDRQRTKIRNHAGFNRFALPGIVITFVTVWLFRYWI